MDNQVLGTARRIASVSPAPAMWAFVAVDLASFALFFAIFMAERSKASAAYARSAELLNVHIGVANTVILIASSWLVAIAVSAAEFGKFALSARLLRGAAIVGLCFAGLKIVEYHAEIVAGAAPLGDAFFTYYFIMTGIHLMHVLAGCVMLSVLAGKMRPPVDITKSVYWLKTGAIYWHMVDVLWLWIFPLLYLQGFR